MDMRLMTTHGHDTKPTWTAELPELAARRNFLMISTTFYDDDDDGHLLLFDFIAADG
jgi:hypothetical protein